MGSQLTTSSCLVSEGRIGRMKTFCRFFCPLAFRLSRSELGALGAWLEFGVGSPAGRTMIVTTGSFLQYSSYVTKTLGLLRSGTAVLIELLMIQNLYAMGLE